MNSDMIWQILRYVLLAIGGYFVNKGLITNDVLTSIISAIGTLFVAGWGIYVKAGTKAVPEATAARPDVPTVSAATGAVNTP
jgi:hypothetical protein